MIDVSNIVNSTTMQHKGLFIDKSPLWQSYSLAMVEGQTARRAGIAQCLT